MPYISGGEGIVAVSVECWQDDQRQRQNKAHRTATEIVGGCVPTLPATAARDYAHLGTRADRRRALPRKAVKVSGLTTFPRERHTCPIAAHYGNDVQ
jgi:hypothetical protein